MECNVVKIISSYTYKTNVPIAPQKKYPSRIKSAVN